MDNIIYKPIKELKPYKKNAKKHPKEQVEQIANCITNKTAWNVVRH